MKNLRKALSLVLALTLIIGVMVVSVGAANFTDSDEIVNTEAVDTLVALNIINGKEDGSYFDPAGIVTRAEMAKMICVALNGGKDPKLGTTTYSYTDTASSWAAGYIEYCTNLGIVAGRGNGIFDPNGTVTGTEAAKMLLVAIGYQAASEGLVGDSWAINTNVLANQKDLYAELETLNPSAGLSRDDAAQMIYNALDAVMVEYEYQLTTVNGILTTVAVSKDVTAEANTILEKKFDMQTGYAYLLGMSYDSDSGKFTYSYDTEGITSDALNISSLKSTSDFSGLFGMKVKVLYKNNSDKTVYGVYAEDSQVLASGMLGGVGTIKTDSFKLGGVVYKTDSATASTPIYVFDNTVTDLDELAATSLGNVSSIPASALSYSMKAIDKDGDGKVDFLVAIPFTVAKVTYVGSTSATVGNVSYKFDDCDIYDGIAKGDYAVIFAADNTAKDEATLVEASKVTGEVTAMESATKIAIDGTTYKCDDSYASAPTFKLGSTYELVVVNGYYFYAEKTSTTVSSSNVCLVNAVNTSVDSISGTLKAQLLMADGTKTTIYVSSVDGDEDHLTTDVTVGTLFTYDVNSDGNYELSAIVSGDYDVAATADLTSIKDGKAATASSTFYFADDAVVFYYNGSAYKVTTGATVNNWADLSGSFDDSLIFANKNSGFSYTELALLNLGVTPDSGDLSYGWITAAPTLVKDGSDYYLKLTIWNGSTTSTYLADAFKDINTGVEPTSFTSVSSSTVASSVTNLQKGNPVIFSDNGDGTITNVYGFKAASNAVIGYADGSDDVAFSSDPVGGTAATTLTLTSDTIILFVDTENSTGVAGGEITIADEPTEGSFTKNCYVLANSSDEIQVIVIDTTNELN